MSWDDDRAVAEFRWVRLMAAVKYDGYGDFRAGMRFIESLAKWLQQFEPSDREIAYAFVRKRMVYLGPAEMIKIVHQLYPRRIRSDLDDVLTTLTGLSGHELLAAEDAQSLRSTLLRKTLFMALSDGARLDEVRHVNAGLIGNEQIVSGTQVDLAKWVDLLKELRTALGDQSARFSQIYLVDDFAGTGTSFFRWKPPQDGKDGKWTGKLARFRESLLRHDAEIDGGLVDDGWRLYVHHYVGTKTAAAHMQSAIEKAGGALAHERWASRTAVTFGMLFDGDFPLRHPVDAQMIGLTEKYYDRRIHDRHMEVGGTTHAGLGYGASALPLVLDHNTPNNSVALLWAESETKPEPGDHSMVPLFRRRKRHT